MIRHVPGYLAALIAALLLFVFIAYPLGSVLIESFAVSGPMSVFELREMTLKALDRLDPGDRDKTVERWVASKVLANTNQFANEDEFFASPEWATMRQYDISLDVTPGNRRPDRR